MSSDQKKSNSARDAKPAAADTTSPNKGQHTGSLTVGIGASAGGLKAVEEFLTALENHPEALQKLSVVFVRHHDPNCKDVLPQLIEKMTSLKVVAIKKSVKLKPNAIYLAPARAVLETENGSIKVVSRESEATATTIDDFFHSLAQDQAANVVGIILSGTGSDGTLGLKSIGDAGGLTFAQTVDSAMYEDMPESAATIGVADHVLSPTEIANELATYVDFLETAAAESRQRTALELEAAIPLIAKLLNSATNHNFKHYKTSTLKRRIQRRMQVLKIPDVENYLERLRNDEAEPHALFRELLISVTAFFRDEEAFELLATKVIPKIFAERKANDHVRIWVSGCATGEEAYSLAILCREQMSGMDEPPEVQIFATDIDHRALAIAREGKYPLGIQDDVSPERLQRFFKKVKKQYAVTKEIRELVMFSAHNLISDPPFLKLDLVSCRNLLIYLGPHLQQKLIPLFHFAIRPQGYLFLGPSENITLHTDLFQPLNARWRIAERKLIAAGDADTSMVIGSNRTSQETVGAAQPVVSRDSSDQDLLEVMQRIVLDEFSPKSVVVDEDGHILCASADVQKYLTFGTGNFQNNIIKMARDGLRIGLRATLQEAKDKRRRIVHDGVSVKVGEDLQRVMITVQPMPRVGENAELFMVIFHDTGLPLSRDEVNREASPDLKSNGVHALKSVNNHSAMLIAHLERELATTREDLERSVNDVEVSNEELKSSYEELLTVNEELHASNEELTTSNEEIEAIARAHERSKNDLENLLQSTQIATIFLDGQFNIRSFTPAATEIYGLIETDVGRPLTQLMPLADDIPPIPSFQDHDPGTSKTDRKSFRRSIDAT